MQKHTRVILRAALATGLGLWAGVAVTQAPEPAGARAFLVGIFSHYPLHENSRFDPVGRSSGAVFDPAMIALFRQNDRLTPKGDEGAIDSDPICSCQDDAGLVVRRMRVAPNGALGATASVDLSFAGGDKLTERFDLVRVDKGWRIHDIHTKDTPSLRAYMIESNRQMAADQSKKPRP